MDEKNVIQWNDVMRKGLLIVTNPRKHEHWALWFLSLCPNCVQASDPTLRSLSLLNMLAVTSWKHTTYLSCACYRSDRRLKGILQVFWCVNTHLPSQTERDEDMFSFLMPLTGWNALNHSNLVLFCDIRKTCLQFDGSVKVKQGLSSIFLSDLIFLFAAVQAWWGKTSCAILHLVSSNTARWFDCTVITVCSSVAGLLVWCLTLWFLCLIHAILIFLSDLIKKTKHHRLAGSWIHWCCLNVPLCS